MKFYQRLCCLLIVFACLCMPFAAAQTPGITLHYEEGGTPLTDASFRLYLIAWEDEGGRLIIAEDFSKYPIDITLDQSRWPALASTLAAYAAFGKIPPVAQGKTDGDGILHFSDLSHGIYLVVGDPHRRNGLTYTAEPTLLDFRGNHIDIFPKAEWVPDGGGDGQDEETIKVLKVWEDGNSQDRPQSVTVHLLRDSLVCDTVELHDGNRWNHTWKNLPTGHDYTLVEEFVDGYTVTIERHGITYVVTNTMDDVTEPVPPDDPDGTIPETAGQFDGVSGQGRGQ